MKPTDTIRSLLVIGCLLLMAIARANAETYGYPYTNPYIATIAGTPSELRAALPEDRAVRKEVLELSVFKHRTVPEVLWFDEKLRYSLAYQWRKAPLVFVIAGTGASYRSSKTRILRNAFFQAGYHVLSLSSPTHPNFIAASSSTGYPGYLSEDAQDLYRVMADAWQQVQNRIAVSEFYLVGYSLGGAQAAFVAKLDEQQKIFDFRKVLLINPPVNLYHSAKRLDAMLVNNIRGGIDNIDGFVNQVYDTIAKVYQRGEAVESFEDFLYTAYRLARPGDREMAALIGLTFRLSSADLLFTSDVLNNAGYIKPKNLVLSPTSSMTDYFIVAYRLSFLDYFHDLFVPYFRSRQPGLTEQALIEATSLSSIEGYLRRAAKVGLMTNQDDLILAPGEVDYLREVFGARAKIYPYGGHCGNMDYKDNVADMLRFLRD